MMIEVRCCCTPDLLLGTLPVQGESWRYAAGNRATFVTSASEVVHLTFTELQFPGGQRRLCFKGDDADLETLRRIGGWVEAT